MKEDIQGYEGDGPLIAFVISLNITREDWPTAQRADIALELKPLMEDGRKQTANRTSREAVAKSVDISVRTMQRAHELRKKMPDLYRRSVDGEFTLRKAKVIMDKKSASITACAKCGHIEFSEAGDCLKCGEPHEIISTKDGAVTVVAINTPMPARKKRITYKKTSHHIPEITAAVDAVKALRKEVRKKATTQSRESACRRLDAIQTVIEEIQNVF
jgi:hypothetical protein